MRRWGCLFLGVGFGLLAAGCPKGNGDYNQGKKAETLQDYDAALTFYQKAVKAEPYNANYKIKLDQIRFEAGEWHVKRGVELRKKGDLQGAAGEFQRAQAVDPSSPIAEQELNKTIEMIAEKNRQNDAAADPPGDPDQAQLAQTPPQIKPLSRAGINMTTMSNDAKIVFETICKIAGLTVVFDPDFPARRITTEFVTGLRQLLDLKRIQQLNSQNAIIVRATPDALLLMEKMIHDIDKAKPEVVVQVEVLEARTDRLRDLGILPGQQATVAFTPNGTTSSSSTGTSSTTSNALSLNQLKHLGTKDYSVTLPGATANAVLTDTYTRIIQNPEIRSVDGQPAKLRIGDRVPVATGSFQAGVGVGSTGGAGFVNPLVNTQFQYIEVGVIVEITPRVHPNREVSMKVSIEVSSVTGTSTIGGIQQPIISQRKVEHEIRLKEGEVSVLGGLIQRTDTKTLNGWPGLAKIPLIRYLFSDDKTDHQEDEVLIVLTPRIVRIPEWTKENLRTVFSGTEASVQVKRESEIHAPVTPPPAPTRQPQQPPVNPNPGAPNAPVRAAPETGAASQGAKIRFEPQSLSLKAGQTATLGIVVENVNDLFSIPLLLQYNPAVISVEEVQHGGFLSGGTQEIAIVQQVFKEKGQAIISATRQPNTPGVNGSGTLLGIVVKALAPGSSNLSIVQVNAKDSQQKSIPLVTSEATLQV